MGVDLRVAGGAVGIGAMFVELFAHGRRAAGIGIDGADAGWSGGAGSLSKRSITHTPRVTGEVVVPLAVSLWMISTIRRNVNAPLPTPSPLAYHRSHRPLRCLCRC